MLRSLLLDDAEQPDAGRKAVPSRPHYRTIL
jgi:hypothetical protein